MVAAAWHNQLLPHPRQLHSRLWEGAGRVPPQCRSGPHEITAYLICQTPLPRSGGICPGRGGNQSCAMEWDQLIHCCQGAEPPAAAQSKPSPSPSTQGVEIRGFVCKYRGCCLVEANVSFDAGFSGAVFWPQCLLTPPDFGRWVQNAQHPAQSLLQIIAAFCLRSCSSLPWREWHLCEEPLLLLSRYLSVNTYYLDHTSPLGADSGYMAGPKTKTLVQALPFLMLLCFLSAFPFIFVMFCFCYLISWLSEKKMAY